ncbi:MAG TPA: glycosyltransferase family 1 protein [Bacteroidales bacterium]|nr:glycosyltransferase family 1 protein [Bacteroidales bacterium]
MKDKLDGIGWFTFETLKRITTGHPEHQFLFLFDRPWDSSFIFSDNIIPLNVQPPTRHPLLWYLWFEKMIPGILKKYKAALFLSPDGYLSLNTPAPSLPVIHDINFAHRPEDLPFFTRLYYRHYFPLFAQKATRIATVSEYSKNDIVNTYRVSPDKIDVVYNGANELYSPLNEEEKTSVRHEYTAGHEFFIFVGTLHPRKNVARLLKAYDMFRSKTDNSIKLLIVGEKMFMTGDIDRTFMEMQYRDDVIFTGRLNPDSLHRVMASALALTFVPLFEGFGIPILEAMYCDTPIISSNITSMPEITGDAGIYADPHSTDSISEAITAVWKDQGLRKNLIEKGRIQRQQFSWDKTADNLWECVEKVL